MAESRRDIERIVAEELPAAPLKAVPMSAKQKLRDLITLFEDIIDHATQQLLNGNLRYRTADKAVEAIDRMSKLKLEALRYMDDLDDGNVGDGDLRAFSDRVRGAIGKLRPQR